MDRRIADLERQVANLQHYMNRVIGILDKLTQIAQETVKPQTSGPEACSVCDSPNCEGAPGRKGLCPLRD